MVASRALQAKRAFVSMLRALAAAYGVNVDVRRESPDAVVTSAFRRVARAVHPDKGGAVEDCQRLHRARDEWHSAKEAPGKRGRKPAATPPAASAVAVARAAAPLPVKSPLDEDRSYRICGQAALFTYQGFTDVAQWSRFVSYVTEQTHDWAVKHWSATLESNADGKPHCHLMLQFRRSIDRSASAFRFEGLRPNVSTHNILGQGVCKSKLQYSIDRGMFYVWADKIGTVRDERGGLCIAGNYTPCWGEGPYRYQVFGAWPEQLWKQRKLTHDVYERYLYLCRDGVPGRRRNLDAVRDREAQVEEEAEIATVTKRIRSTPGLYKSFPVIPEAMAWRALFETDRLRYPILVVLGPSFSGKTEWAKSLFSNPLELKIGSLTYFPDKMRQFDRTIHDGLVLDDVRDLNFLSEHQDKLQGKYDARVEFASTPGGTCSYSKFLFAVPIVATVNFSTKNLSFLESHDWLRNEGNRVVVNFSGFA